tara:strand:- start:698 stop:829 length:132 start_codon:yes stop_codon:yes gene_type:complete
LVAAVLITVQPIFDLKTGGFKNKRHLSYERVIARKRAFKQIGF